MSRPGSFSKVLRWVVAVAVFGGLLFGLAGRWDLPMLWAYVGVCAVLALVLTFTIDPELAKERRRPGPGGVDRRRRLGFGFLFVTVLVVSTLDVGRFHWSDTVPGVLRVTALVVFTAAIGLVIWAVGVNRFFSPVVRIQTERGHHLVNTGPYRYVRHPGYLGLFFALPSVALAIGSWWALVAALANSLLVLGRLVVEERFLRANLAGYAQYMRTVRYRLVPGLW